MTRKLNIDWNNCIVVVAKIRQYLKERSVYPLFITQFEDFIEQLNNEIRIILTNAIIRAKLNNRKTVKEADL